ncbi:MAG: DUF4465 domain-containing protein [Paludibacter sp.]|nr:DUF4465 domain-containing protein [Paludibacter sp.]
MKTTKLFLAIGILGMAFTSCKDEANVQTTLVDFENVTLTSDSIWNGSDLSGKFISGNSTFTNSYNPLWASWSGFACSSKKDSISAGYENQYSVMAGSGALSSKKYALAYDSAAISIPKTTDFYSIKSLYITNSTWAYLGLKNGNYGIGGFGKKFAAGDWFKVTLKGYKSNVLTSSVDIYLADFRNGKNIILKNWTKVDVSALGLVDMVTFTFDSTDKSGGWLNTPAYACIDNIEFTQTIPVK